MKKVPITSLIFILTTILYGQEMKISVAPTISVAPAFLAVGGPGQNAKLGLSFSLDYRLLNDKRINFGIGLCYQYSQVEFVPNLNSVEMLLHTEKVNLISIRFKSVYNFKKYYYLSLDPSVDFHLGYDSDQTLDNQSGIGLSFGFGKNIKIKEALFLNVEPKVCIHNIIPFNKTNPGYRLTSAGLNLGLVFGPKDLDN